MTFEFATAKRIIFGPGTARQAGELATKLGKNALVVTGKDPDRNRFIFQDLEANDVRSAPFSIPEEPTLALISSGADEARRAGCDLVVAIGGGSVMDSGKAIAALLTNYGDLIDYLEVVGKGESIEHRPAPTIVLPTTAGTGAEVTCNSVLLSAKHQVKVSMRSPLMLPTVAIVDPELTYCMPPDITAATGLDAVTQLIEAFVSINANPMTDAICREGIKRAAAALDRAWLDGSDKTARYDMCLSSLFGGMALANAKLGAVHGIAGPFGGMFSSPHGAVCGKLLPEVMQMNITVLEDRLQDINAVARYDEIAKIVTADRRASAKDGAAWAKNLCDRFHIPPLRSYGFSENDFNDLIERSQRASSMKGNPVLLKDEEIRLVLRRAL